MNSFRLIVAAVAALAAPTAFAQSQSQSSERPTAVDDKLFAAAAAESGMKEIAMSRLGIQKSSDAELKSFSEKMVEDHTRLNAELAQLASQKGMAVPRELGACPQFTLQSLAGLSGEHFDKCYAEAQYIAHKDAVAAFTAESERGLDADVKALAAKALPKIKMHLEAIKPIAMKYEKGAK